MNKKLQESILGRSTPKKRHVFRAFINSKLKQHRSDTGLVEDSSSSTVIIRVIVGLLLLHLVLIGGALLRGQIKKSGGGAVAVSTLTTPPPATPAAADNRPSFPEQTSPVTDNTPTNTGAVNLTQVHPVTTPATNKANTQADTKNHITQVAAVGNDDTAEEVEPAAPAQPRRAAQLPANTVAVKHLVASGDTWSSIAVANNTTVEALKAANPEAARRINLIAGAYIQVPVAANSPQARTAAAQQAAAAAQEKVHVIAKGETLGGIARKYKISLKKLMQLNGMTDADARKIRPGQKLKVSQ